MCLRLTSRDRIIRGARAASFWDHVGIFSTMLIFMASSLNHLDDIQSGTPNASQVEEVHVIR